MNSDIKVIEEMPTVNNVETSSLPVNDSLNNVDKSKLPTWNIEPPIEITR